MKKQSTKNILIAIIQSGLITLWGLLLLKSDAYRINYALLLVIAYFCVYKNIKSGDISIHKNYNNYSNIILYSFAALFSIMIAGANYRIYALISFPKFIEGQLGNVFKSIVIVVFLFGGFLVFENIFNVIISNIKSIVWKKITNSFDYKKIFIISFITLVLTRLFILYFCQYPGLLTRDSINQMNQLMTNNYTNHHPFYHTMVIKLFITLGLKLFGDINAAVATYSVFQIMFTAISFSFAVSTMAMMKAPKWIIVISMLFYIVMPYHVTYAITMWKDVMFGCFILLLVTFIYRYMVCLGSQKLNYIMFALSSLGTCLFRSNGFFVYVILALIFFGIWKLKYKKMIFTFIFIILISFILKHPVLTGLGVKQPDTIEHLSIPAQQIARVVYKGCELEVWQQDLLEKIIDVDKIPESYVQLISDPIKNLVRQKGNQHLIVEKKYEYIKLYISLGLKHPVIYLCA